MNTYIDTCGFFENQNGTILHVKMHPLWKAKCAHFACQNGCILTRKTYAFWKAKGMLFVGRSRQGLLDAAGQPLLLYPLHAAEVNALFWTKTEGKAKKNPLTC